MYSKIANLSKAYPTLSARAINIMYMYMYTCTKLSCQHASTGESVQIFKSYLYECSRYCYMIRSLLRKVAYARVVHVITKNLTSIIVHCALIYAAKTVHRRVSLQCSNSQCPGSLRCCWSQTLQPQRCGQHFQKVPQFHHCSGERGREGGDRMVKCTV